VGGFSFRFFVFRCFVFLFSFLFFSLSAAVCFLGEVSCFGVLEVSFFVPFFFLGLVLSFLYRGGCVYGLFF